MESVQRKALRKSSLKRLHKTEVVQEARMMRHSFLGRRKTNRQVCLTLNYNLEARSEQIQTNATRLRLRETYEGLERLSKRVSSKRYFTM